MSDLLRKVRRLVGDSEIPVPEGHARRHKGLTHVFVKPEDAQALYDRMRESFGEPHSARSTHLFRKGHDRLWLTMPNPDSPGFATVSL